MPYTQLTVFCNDEVQEILISILSENGSTGFEQTVDSLTAYFNGRAVPDDVLQLLAPYQYRSKTLEDKNWNEEWESNFSPVVVPGACAVRAHFHEAVTTVPVEIIITPKMSFGTGHHATTFLMLQQMHHIHFTNKSVFDFGTGTGILAIYAEKIGAAFVDAIDVDEWSITNAIENAAQNNCNRIALKQSTELPQKTYDIVLANINRNVILDYAAGLKKIMQNGSMLLLSGLLCEDEIAVDAAMQKEGLHHHQTQCKDGWIVMLYNKPA